MNTPKSFVKYAVTAGIDLAVAAVYFFANLPVSEIKTAAAVDIVLVLCDAFFIPGMLTLMVGLLMWVSSEGALDGVAYLGSYVAKTFIPGKRSTIERYADYTERRRKNRKKGFGFLCVVGLVFVVIAGVFQIAFNMLY